MMNRRETLRLVAGTAAALWAADTFFSRSFASATRVLAPEEEEGPFYLPAERVRRDITEGKPGVPLDLRITLVDVSTCQPLTGAAVDIWHCDASGVYSGFTKMKMGPPPGQADGFEMFEEGPAGPPPGGGGGPGHHAPTDGTTFLRGIQLTDARGVAGFSTLYPGWYAGREIHIHLKVHPAGTLTKTGVGRVCHTGQLFFPDETNAAISKLQPYAASTTERTTKETDHVYREQNGIETVMAVHTVSTLPSSGYRAALTLAVDSSASPVPVGMR